MKFRIQLSSERDSEHSWWEDYDKNISDPQKWAEDTVKWYNSTRREREEVRKLLAVEIFNRVSRAEHTWKKLNSVTITARDGIYDVYQCTECKITSKRFGLSPGMTLDPRYAKAKVFLRCDTSQKHLKVLAERRAAKKTKSQPKPQEPRP